MSIAVQRSFYDTCGSSELLEATACLSDLLPGLANFGSKGLLFCYRAVLEACRAYLGGRYSAFDAHTTTNCCHGISVFAREVLFSCSPSEFLDVAQVASEHLMHMGRPGLGNVPTDWPDWHIPKSALWLTKLYLMGLAAVPDSKKTRRCVPDRLQAVSPVSRAFRDRLVKGLQRELSNLVAERYQELGATLDADMLSAGVPLREWAGYVQRERLRKDMRGRLYAPCVHSMQVCLAYLAQSGAKIAVRCERGGKMVQAVLVHDGSRWVRTGGLNEEPVVVFSGFATGDGLEDWLERFDHLVLANDLHYPQFPAVRDDPQFDSSPIEPEERELREAFERHQVVKGVSLKDPSLFCLTHIYPASVGELQGAQLPSYLVQA